ncbi:uncharacterized protein ACOB7L_019178 [Callospermophilus lateralis]|uniref:uncharacterized protein LOC143404571 n=1 Tax=Callospermophilus lateralis TaxID=76772 RepID=UPI004053D9AD
MYSSSSSSRRRRRRRRLGGPGGEVTVPPPCPCVASRCSSRPSRAKDGVAAAVFRATSLDLGANAQIVRTRVRADFASFYCILLLIKKLSFTVAPARSSPELSPRPPPPPRDCSGVPAPARQNPAPPKPPPSPAAALGPPGPPPPPLRPHPAAAASGFSAQKQQPRRRQLRAPPLPRPAGCTRTRRPPYGAQRRSAAHSAWGAARGPSSEHRAFSAPRPPGVRHLSASGAYPRALASAPLLDCRRGPQSIKVPPGRKTWSCHCDTRAQGRGRARGSRSLCCPRVLGGGEERDTMGLSGDPWTKADQ